MSSPVQGVFDAGSLSAGDRDGDLVVPTSAVGERVGSLNRGSRDQDQIGNASPIQRKLQDADIVHDLADTRAPRLHQGGIRLNIDFIGNLSHLKNRVDCRIAVHLQSDPGRHVCAEARQRCFESIRPYRQVCKNVRSGLIAYSAALQTGVRVRQGDLDTRQNGSSLIFDGAAELRRRLRQHDGEAEIER